MRNAGAQPFALGRPPAFARNIGGGPRLVDEDEAFGKEIELAVEPVLAPFHNVRLVLFAGVGGLSLNVRPPRSPIVQTVEPAAFTSGSAKSRPRGSRIVSSGVASIKLSRYAVRVKFGTPRLSLFARQALSPRARPTHPDDCGGLPNPEMRGGVTRRASRQSSINHAIAQILGLALAISCLHSCHDKGIAWFT